MNDTQFQEVIQLLNKKEKTETSKMVDVIFKGVGSLSLALIVWVLSTVNDMQKNAIDQRNKTENLVEDIKEIKKFTKEPRFTAENFENRIVPLINQLNLNTQELNKRDSRISDIEDKNQLMELRLSKLENH